MPRQARLDIPGQLYHVMSRGIERRHIFIDDADRADFRDRISLWLKKAGGKCLAWCLMPNHFHLLLLRGPEPLSGIMHHAMTGYAINFNLRHRRAGHLFQNRYKSIICDLEEYLHELVPYIHLNPVRAGLVKDLAALRAYKWCGHASMLTGVPDEMMDREEVLEHYGGAGRAALGKYLADMAEKLRESRRKDLSGGGLERSFGEGRAVPRSSRAVEKVSSDQRILGKTDFVESVLRSAGEALGREKKSCSEVKNEVTLMTGLDESDLFRHTHERQIVNARAIYCCISVEEAGASNGELSKELGMTPGAISKLIHKGKTLLAARKLGR